MTTIDKTTIKEFNLKRYLGKWYEIARFNHRFERGLQGVTAEYSLREDGKVKVLNCGHKHTLTGEQTCTTGKARLPKDGQSGKLEVSFFLFFYSDYNILELGKDYEWALVGSSTDKYLWILSRTPPTSVRNPELFARKSKTKGI